MKKINYFLLAVLSVSLSITSCKKEEVKVEYEFDNGIFVVNEGNFGQGNASLSFADKDVQVVKNDVFFNKNQAQLGDVAQSIGFNGDNAYIVVNGSDKITVVNRNTMEYKVTIASGLENPRYFEALNEQTALVSCWGDPMDDTDDYLAIVNTSSQTVTGSIPVNLGPEKMIKNDNYLFIAHKGAWGTNNKVSVYDLTLHQITHIIEVGNRPNSLIIEDDYLWVLCSGEPSWTGNETAGQLYKISLPDFSISQVFDFATNEHPNFLTSNDDKLYYYLNGKIYQMDIDDTALPTSEFITYQGNAYNMEAYDDYLYITDAKDYVQEGELIVYDLSNGQEKSRKTVGIIPGDIGFNFE